MSIGIGGVIRIITQTKQGGRAFRSSQCQDFTNFTDSAGLIDLGARGNPYTWENARLGKSHIGELLDRAISNAAFIASFPQVQVTNLVITYTTTKMVKETQTKRPVNYISGLCEKRDPVSSLTVTNFYKLSSRRSLILWKRKLSFTEFLSNFLANVNSWNSNVFRNLKLKKKTTLARINGIQKALALNSSHFLINLEKSLLSDLNAIYRMKRVIWAQKAGINWRKFGDYNTKYFHILAKVKRSRGKIVALNNVDGVLIEDIPSLKSLARAHFISLFSSSIPPHSASLPCPAIQELNENECSLLPSIPSLEEVKSNLFLMDPIKSPSPDGLQPLFFQQFWEGIGHHIHLLSLKFLGIVVFQLM
ncbi:uncharacterized protein LOC110691632 [Chenopodium quinoa]|uniref:uncharacterized protein LOC110691632 n=1 Tax=Chenopodium quinoa TaxID=63459 RepID=UPI000B78911D|nr:uncharacterized protein LOC110691632 [Chenopodium quinoa]